MSDALFIGICGVVLGWFGRMLFGPSQPKAGCGQYPCSGRPDPRCAGENCSHHCMLYCQRRCMDAYERDENAGEIAKQILEQARR